MEIKVSDFHMFSLINVCSPYKFVDTHWNLLTEILQMVEKCKFYCNIGPGVPKAGVSNGASELKSSFDANLTSTP